MEPVSPEENNTFELSVTGSMTREEVLEEALKLMNLK